jgi:putative NADH-flavin reductase
MIGSRIVAEAAGRGHQVIAGSRHPEKVASHANIKAVQIDANDAQSIASAAEEADVIVMSVSPRSGGDPLQEARQVSDAAMSAAKTTGKRLFYVGGAGSLLLPDGTPVAETLPDEIKPEALAMREVRDQLKNSDLNWTVLCPPAMIQPGEKKGSYRLGSKDLMFNEQGESAISAEDYADAVVNELENPAHLKAQFTIAY